MIVTRETKFTEFEHADKYISDASRKEMKDAAERVFVGMYDLKLWQFIACSHCDYSCVLGDYSDPTVMQVYWTRRFTEFVEEFANTLKGLQVPQTKAQKNASVGVPKPSTEEAFLIFTRSYFGLHSFKEAEQITVGEFLIAKRDEYATALYSIKLQRIQVENMKNKK